MTLAVCGVLLGIASPLAAQEKATGPKDEKAAAAAPAETKPVSMLLGGAIGAGIVIIAQAWASGRIGAAAVESMARQPEVAGNVRRHDYRGRVDRRRDLLRLDRLLDPPLRGSG